MKSVGEVILSLEKLTHVLEDQSSARLLTVEKTFVPPTLHVNAISQRFEDMDFERRLALLDDWLAEVDPAKQESLGELMARLPVTVSALSPAEAADREKWTTDAGRSSWVSWFLNDRELSRARSAVAGRYVHFYGYKGGQGRSTVLGLVAKSLADDGYRVLLVDADVEAPTLDTLFGAFADTYSQTLMGLCGWSNEITPIAGAYSGRTGGRVDLLPCRPRNEAADLDFALLIATAPLNARIYERAAARLEASISSAVEHYDYVLLDHRTGIATSVLPLITSLPGSAAIFARTDSNTASLPSELLRVVRSIFSAMSDIPGAFVSFSLDPNKAIEGSRSPEEARAREQLLEELATVIERTGDNDQTSEEVSPNEVSLNWIDWFLDRALLSPSLPDVNRLQSDNVRSIERLREALGLPLGRKPADMTAPALIQGANSFDSQMFLSGAKDQGQFIHIPEAEKLLAPGNPFTYVLGRKGTGKTRLLREIAERGLGTPLLVAEDQASTGALQSQSVEANEWIARCNSDPHVFWWSLLRAGLMDESTGSSTVVGRIVDFIAKGESPKTLADRLAIKATLISQAKPRVFLIDGLETLVPAGSIKLFVAGLLDMMGTIQNDPAVASKVVIRAFVREDLASDAVQNIEQRIEGRSIRLKWSAASILNFAISRLPSLHWIRNTFTEVCAEIEKRKSAIQRSELSEQEATELLLRVFPGRMRRNNLSTATFLRLYFSDAGGDDTHKATFYPRLYLSFLQGIDKLSSEHPTPLDRDARIDSALLMKAYDEASTGFITETKQELGQLLALEYENDQPSDDGQTRVSKFIDAFDGLSTPFHHETLVLDLHERTGFTESTIRESLRRMKSIRMFEDRPGYGGWWRVGQLYKMGLRMKYVRTGASKP